VGLLRCGDSGAESGGLRAAASGHRLCRGGPFWRGNGLATDLLSRLPQQPFQRLRCIPLQPWQHVAIRAERQRFVGVPQPFGHDFGVHATGTVAESLG